MITLAELTVAGLQAIEAITKSLHDAHAGKVTPDEAFAQIVTNHATLAAGRAVDDQALAERFR